MHLCVSKSTFLSAPFWENRTREAWEDCTNTHTGTHAHTHTRWQMQGLDFQSDFISSSSTTQMTDGFGQIHRDHQTSKNLDLTGRKPHSPVRDQRTTQIKKEKNICFCWCHSQSRKVELITSKRKKIYNSKYNNHSLLLHTRATSWRSRCPGNNTTSRQELTSTSASKPG